MSGGHWDYVGLRIMEGLEEVGQDPEVARRFPALAPVLAGLGRVLYEIEHELDWDLSADASIENDEEFERAALKRVRDAVAGEEMT